MINSYNLRGYLSEALAIVEFKWSCKFLLSVFGVSDLAPNTYL